MSSISSESSQSRTYRRDRTFAASKRWYEDWPESPLPPLPASFDSSAHPELEDRSVLAWGVVQCEKYEGIRATIDVLYGVGTDLSKDNLIDIKRELILS